MLGGMKQPGGYSYSESGIVHRHLTVYLPQLS